MSEHRLGSLQMLVLRVLLDSPGLSGADAVRALAARGSPVRVGTVYTTLDRLEARGAIEARRRPARAVRGGRGGWTWTVTAAGRKEFEEALRELGATA